jgi:hypothetical protein
VTGINLLHHGDVSGAEEKAQQLKLHFGDNNKGYEELSFLVLLYVRVATEPSIYLPLLYKVLPYSSLHDG